MQYAPRTYEYIQGGHSIFRPGFGRRTLGAVSVVASAGLSTFASINRSPFNTAYLTICFAACGVIGELPAKREETSLAQSFVRLHTVINPVKEIRTRGWRLSHPPACCLYPSRSMNLTSFATYVSFCTPLQSASDGVLFHERRRMRCGMRRWYLQRQRHLHRESAAVLPRWGRSQLPNCAKGCVRQYLG